jgi:predicted XRE-type DNA-binding protein
MPRRGSGQRTAQLMEALRDWCGQKRGRPTAVSKMLGITPSQVSDWFAGRRQMTGEQALAVSDLLRTMSAYPEMEAQLTGENAFKLLHESLENPEKKSVWVREIEPYTHIILGGPHRAAMRDELVAFMKKGRQ